jgi:hypothetical protein
MLNGKEKEPVPLDGAGPFLLVTPVRTWRNR